MSSSGMGIIEVQDFKKSFGSKLVHKGVSFSVRKGECLGLIGGSGAGKSVILRSLIGLEKPDSGKIHVFGQDIVPLKEEDLVDVRKKVAYVFQGGALFDSMSVFDNLAYPLREHTQLSEAEISIRVLKLLEDFGLSGNDRNFPASLSGGMQKRVGLARAIILEPEVVLYDEPTAGLDPYNTKRIQEMILRLKKMGVTSILVTHDMPSAFAVCDRIALLLNGKISSEGTQAEMEARPDSPIHHFINGEEP
ncbi:MAG: ABC transporter ATP-binding protein [Bdellovibrionales bacterium]|nr:ABC transporter ATP-binding protein [Bdellovibrionales bacterium]